jgi:hypothetical protein
LFRTVIESSKKPCAPGTQIEKTFPLSYAVALGSGIDRFKCILAA